MSYSRSILPGALCLLLAGLPAWSDAGIVVHASDDDYRTGEVDTTTTSGFFSLITRERLQDQQELATVIEQEAAVQIRQSGGQGSFATVSLRGASSDQVMIYVDGLPLNTGASASVDLGLISLSDIERIEIYRGSTPPAFARASLGGVVNIRRLRQLPASASLRLGYGAFGSRSLWLQGGGQHERWDYLASAAQAQADNDFPFWYDNRTPHNPNDDRYERRNNDQYRQRNLLLRAGYRLDADIRLELALQGFDKTKGLPSWNNAASARTRFDTREQRLQWQLTHDRLGRGLSGRLRLDLSDKREIYDDRLGQVGLGRQYLEYRSRTQAVNAYLERTGERHLLSAAIDLHWESYRPIDRLGGSELNRSQRRILTLVLADQWLPADSLQLTPALRAYQIDDRRRSALPSLLDPGIAMSRRSRYLAPQLGARLELGANTVVKTNLGRYYREPTFFELFGDQGFFLGNDQLQAESALNFDLGLEWDRHWQRGPLRRLHLGLSYFDNRVDQLITRSYDARGIGKAVNIAQARITGLETQLKLEPAAGPSLSANLTAQQPRNQSRAIPAFYGKRLPGRYVLASLVRLEQRLPGHWRVHLEWRFEGGQYYDSANLLPARDKHEINAGLGQRLGPLRWSLQGRNLGNNRYQDFRGYPQPGRAFYAQLHYDLQPS